MEILKGKESKMKALTKLSVVLLTLTTSAQQEAERIRWNAMFSPAGGYRSIHHRSQKKKRILARRTNSYV